MPRWGIAALKWGGLAVAVLNLIAIVFGLSIGAQPTADVTPANGPTVPYAIYTVLLLIGAMASFFGFLMERRQRRHEPR